jgi:hypothetical protein
MNIKYALHLPNLVLSAMTALNDVTLYMFLKQKFPEMMMEL